MSNDIKENLTKLLLSTGCLKFGEFTLKSGATSNYYIDLRESTLHAELFQTIVKAIKDVITKKKYDSSKVAIVGCPYGAVPVAAAVAFELKTAYYPVRKEVKNYGRKTDANLLEDHFYILIEDVMSSGSSIIETIEKLKGKKVTDVIVVVDREAGGFDNLKTAYPNIELNSILKVSDILHLHNNSGV